MSRPAHARTMLFGSVHRGMLAMLLLQSVVNFLHMWLQKLEFDSDCLGPCTCAWYAVDFTESVAVLNCQVRALLG